VRQIAIIGSGPAGYYTAEAAIKLWGTEVRVDILDMLPVPYGLIRTGVAPDHQSIKARLTPLRGDLAGRKRALHRQCHGRADDISIEELRGLYDAVVLATGAPHDKKAGLPGEDFANVYGSAAFVGWYNGHPASPSSIPTCRAARPWSSATATSRSTSRASFPRHARNSPVPTSSATRSTCWKRPGVERIVILGRRGPHQIAMTPKELGELAHLARAMPARRSG
jgi:hypothetical protein